MQPSSTTAFFEFPAAPATARIVAADFRFTAMHDKIRLNELSVGLWFWFVARLLPLKAHHPTHIPGNISDKRTRFCSRCRHASLPSASASSISFHEILQESTRPSLYARL